jgi:hypothetical protein
VALKKNKFYLCVASRPYSEKYPLILLYAMCLTHTEGTDRAFFEQNSPLLISVSFFSGQLFVSFNSFIFFEAILSTGHTSLTVSG